MTHKPRFVAKTSKIESLPAVIDQQPVAVQMPDIPNFDLKKLNMVEVATELSRMLDRPQPRTWIGKYFAERRLKLDNENINHIVRYVERIRQVNQNVTNLQAELLLAPAVLQQLIEGHYREAKQAIERQVKEHEDYLKQIDDAATARELNLAMAREQVEALKATTHLTKMQGALLEKIVNEMDLNNISATQAALLVKAINPNASATSSDFMAQEIILTEQLNKMRAENEKVRAEARHKNAEAKQQEIQAKLDEHTASVTINEKTWTGSKSE